MIRADLLGLNAVGDVYRHDLIELALSSLPIAFVVASVDGNQVVIHFASQYFASLMGATEDVLVGKDYLNFFSPQSDAVLKALFVDSITSQEDKSFSFCFVKQSYPKDSLWLDVDVRHALFNARSYVVILHRDASEHAQTCETLRRLASHDYLTSLPNRMAFDAYVNDLIVHIRTDEPLVVCLIDLNRFKPVNDKFGHSIGDLVLQEIGRRLLDYVNASEMVARIGGDEFAIVLRAFESTERLVMRLETFVDVISAPYLINDKTIISIGASFGFACYPEHGKDVSELLCYADQQMYLQKTERS